MAQPELTHLDKILSELNEDGLLPSDGVTGQVSAHLDALPATSGRLVRAYLMPEGLEHETDSIFRARSALAHRGQLIRGAALLVAHWLQTCQLNHPECLRPSSPDSRSSSWPRRLVDLIDYEPAALSGTSYVRVVETGSQREPYCTLSYRWPLNPVRLTSETSAELFRGISSDEISGSIQDACTLAKHLGIRYVWVDALCIMQNATGDWHREAKKMADIYTNAVFTVATVDGTRLGKVASVEPFLREPDRLAAMDDSLANPENVYRNLLDTQNFASRDEGALDGRGWCFQEKMLSRRIISITSTDIFWDCLHHSASGRRPCGIVGDFSPGFRDLDDRTFKRLLLGTPAATFDQADAYWQWRKAVEDYTRRSLTRREDRLIALEGITSRMSQVLGDKCVVSIWSKDPIRSLIWFASPTSDPYVQDLPGIEAPSWSWASVGGPISYRLWHPYERYLHRKGETLVQAAIVEAMSAESEDGGFAKFKGTLRINGPVITGHLRGETVFIRKERCPVHDLSSRGETLEASKAIYDDERAPYEKRLFHHEKLLLDPRPSGPQEERRRGFLPLGIPPREGPPGVRQVKCLLLCEGGYNTPLKAQYCIVLERENGQWGNGLRGVFPRNELYRRIGLCVIDSMQFSRHETCRHGTNTRSTDGIGSLTTYCAQASQESWALRERVDIC